MLSCDAVTAWIYGEVRDRLRLKGRPIPENDLWIAAIAIQHDLALATRDDISTTWTIFGGRTGRHDRKRISSHRSKALELLQRPPYAGLSHRNYTNSFQLAEHLLETDSPNLTATLTTACSLTFPRRIHSIAVLSLPRAADD